MNILTRLQYPMAIAFTCFVLCVTTAWGADTPLSEEQKSLQSGSDIHVMMSGLSDEQVRRLLIDELQKGPTDKTTDYKNNEGPGAFFEHILSELETTSNSSDDKARDLLKKMPTVFPDLYRVFVTLCPQRTTKGALFNMAGAIFFILLGFAAEAIVKRTILPKIVQAESLGSRIKPTHSFEKFTASLALKLQNIIGLFIFFGAAYFCFMFFMWVDLSSVRLFFLATLISITFIRAIRIIADMLLSPYSPDLRIFPIDSSMAVTGYKLVSWTTGYAVVGMMFIVISKKLGTQPATVTLLQLLIATVLLCITAGCTLLFKNRIKEIILNNSDAQNEQPSWGRQQFASIWHILALLYLGCLWILLFSNLLNPSGHTRGAFLLSFFIIPIWIIADMTLQWIVRYSMATLKIYNNQDQHDHDVTEEEQVVLERGKRTYTRVLHVARAFLVFGLFIWVANLWNIKIPIFSRLSSALFDTLIILTLAMMFWKFISNWIERKIAESIPEEEEGSEDSDDEWGSAATRGRSYTLLPMLRRFIGTILVTMVTLTILSSMGVDIGPLLAGAGVVGLAVGFGAQKLVADMFSGFFYLLDDAFRVGEYIEAGNIMGTVENISLRNVMLRHHRGMLQIVPHSELGSITNYMRGGIVVKFNLDFPYDADIDKIRKIIKKVGIAMLEDEELGGDFIKQVKSQGVREITNSVMTIRVKFTAKPGTHFVIRREAYRRITEALRAKGIEYAHKKVIVDIPQAPAGTQAATTEQLTQAAAAAAQNAQEEELAQKNQSSS